jgi:hypothetical protein
MMTGHFGRSSAAEPRRGQPGKEPAPAIADDAEPAGGLDGVARGGDVAEGGVGVRLPLHVAADHDVAFAVTDLEIGLDAVEQGGRDGRVTVRREAVSHFADVVVDAEDLLDHDDAAARLAGRVSAVRRKLVPIRSGQ